MITRGYQALEFNYSKMTDTTILV